MKKTNIIFLSFSLLAAACGLSSPKPYGPVPTEAQLAWQRMEVNMFCHFGPNTFTGAEWGSGEESEEVFAPTALDCRQWVDVACQAGMGGIILTAKHHDGFCLWPSQYSSHTVADSLDVLRALRTAIDEHNSDLQPPTSDLNAVGLGMVGELDSPTTTKSFLLKVKELTGIPTVRYAGGSGQVQRVALCGGSGSDFIGDAIASKADIYLTADLKYHDFQRATGTMALADIGHYESEQFAKEIISRAISKKFSNFACRISEKQGSLVSYI